MAPRQPNNQTKQKSTWWSITSFDPGEQEWLKAGIFPEFVSEVLGGLEECPDTKRIHFQGALRCRSQQRFSAIKKILPKSHIEMANCPPALSAYAMKEDTAVEKKEVRLNSTPYYTLEKLLLLLACQPTEDEDDEKLDFWHRANMILLTKPYLIGLLAKPDTYRAWSHTRMVWHYHVTDKKTFKTLTEEELIVLQVLPGHASEGSGLISNTVVYNAEDGVQEITQSSPQAEGEESSSTAGSPPGPQGPASPEGASHGGFAWREGPPT